MILPYVLLLLMPLSSFGQTFEYYSIQTEKVVTDWIEQGAKEIVIATNSDTVFRFRINEGAIIARQTPFDFDSSWSESDSVFHLHKSVTRSASTIQVFYNGQKKRLLKLKNNKAVYHLHQEQDSIGKTFYTNEWWPNQQIIKQQFPSGRESTKILSPYSGSWTYRETHGDTNRVYQMEGTDTSNHNISWPGYHEVKRYRHFYVSKDWQKGDTLIHSMQITGMADSTLIWSQLEDREYWHYRSNGVKSGFELQLYSNSKGRPQVQSVYNYRPKNDTATYQWEYYGLLPSGAYRKLKEYRLRKDSSRYKEITYVWKENGEIDHLEIKNRWGITRNREPNWHKVTLPVGDDMSIPYRVRPVAEKSDYRLKIVDKNIRKIKYGDESLAFVLASTLSTNTDLALAYYQDFGREFLLLELTESGTIRALMTQKNSALNVKDVINAIGDEPFTLPTEIKTNVYAVYEDGTKRQEKYDGILVPIEVLIQQH